MKIITPITTIGGGEVIEIIRPIDKIIIPTFIPFDLGSITGKKRKKKIAKQVQFAKYQPSLVAEFLGIKGIKPSRITGLEVRPILASSSIFKASKKRSRKKRGKKK
jgi:hypothetical protein